MIYPRASLALIAMTATLLSTVATSQPASAKTLVTCGPKGAAYIVNVVPAGCRVLGAASPPKQAGNPVEDSALGFYFRASVPQTLSPSTPIASLPSHPLTR